MTPAASAPRFYLGTHRVGWLGQTGVPLFVSAAQLRGRRSFPRALGPWALDSAGFTELELNGRWSVDARTYAAEVRRWAAAIGMPDFAAIQDWMCAPPILSATGLTVVEHQRRTVDSYRELRELAPEIPWMPVLQGWAAPEYLDHMDMYRAAGFDLAQLPIVGVGSIARRQATSAAHRIITAVASEGIRIHALGAKTEGLRLFGSWIASADSMAWSYVARRQVVLLEDCRERGGHKNCANCLSWALTWYRELLAAPMSAGAQGAFAWGRA